MDFVWDNPDKIWAIPDMQHTTLYNLLLTFSDISLFVSTGTNCLHSELNNKYINSTEKSPNCPQLLTET